MIINAHPLSTMTSEFVYELNSQKFRLSEHPELGHIYCDGYETGDVCGRSSSMDLLSFGYFPLCFL